MQLGQLELFYYIHSQSEGSGVFGGVDKTAGLQSTFEWKDQCHLSVLQCGRCMHALLEACVQKYRIMSTRQRVLHTMGTTSSSQLHVE